MGVGWVLSGISSLEKHTGVSSSNSDKRKSLYSFSNNSFSFGSLLINLSNVGVKCPNFILEARIFFRYYREVRVFKYTRFSRFASKEGITDHELLGVVDQLEAEQADSNLGGDVYKVRIARQGKGKSGGHRVIVYFRNEHRTFFSYGFSKNDKGNISEKELKVFKEDAKLQFSFTEEQIKVALQKGTLIEIIEEV